MHVRYYFAPAEETREFYYFTIIVAFERNKYIEVTQNTSDRLSIEL